MGKLDPAEILRLLAVHGVEFVVVEMCEGHQLLTTMHGDLYCLGTVGDGQSYEDLLDRAPELDLGNGVVVRVIELSALIELKEKAGRPKDLAVLPVLRATFEEVRRREPG
jgi:hypothetical protein